MTEPRKNHLTIDGGQVKEDDHVSSYKPIPESDTDFRTSKSSLSKSKEKVSGDGAEEKLLSKEDEAKITTRVDMADAKYVVGDHRNGDAKIELDANKRQFSGLTKEELMKYADDPFWVRLRWFMFVLFWVLWLCMLAGAIAIIIKAPKCSLEPKKWYEKGPLVSSADLESDLPGLEKSKILGVFYETPTYEVLDNPSLIDNFKKLVATLKDKGIQVIVDLTPGFVSTNHSWFSLSENRSELYKDYFIWGDNKGFDDGNNPIKPNNWASTLDGPSWTFSDVRKQFYEHQFEDYHADLNFSNPSVVKQFDDVIEKYMKAGAAGIRLNKFRHLMVDVDIASSEERARGRGADMASDHTQYAYWRHDRTRDLPGLDALLLHWAALLDKHTTHPGETVFTLAEDSSPELHRLERNSTALSSLRPPSTATIPVLGNMSAVAKDIRLRLKPWPIMKLTSTPESESELAILAMLLPATPLLDVGQLFRDSNSTDNGMVSHVISLRSDASVEYGHVHVAAVSAVNALNATQELLACARWKHGHTGYVALFNPWGEEGRANLTGLPSLPPALSLHHMSSAAKAYSNYTSNQALQREDVLVPPQATILLSYVPDTTADH